MKQFLKNHDYIDIKNNIFKSEKDFYSLSIESFNKLDTSIIDYLSYINYILNEEEYKSFNKPIVYQKLKAMIASLQQLKLIQQQGCYNQTNKKHKGSMRKHFYELHHTFQGISKKK